MALTTGSGALSWRSSAGLWGGCSGLLGYGGNASDLWVSGALPEDLIEFGAECLDVARVGDLVADIVGGELE